MNILEYENYHENKNHALDDFSYNTYLCSIPLDFSEVPPHWHEELEFIYIKKGDGLVTVDFREYHVHAGSLILVRPGQLHAIRQLEEFPMEYENILFSPDLLISKRETQNTQNFYDSFLTGILHFPTHFIPVYPYYEDLIRCVDACDEIMKTRPLGFELYIKSKLYEFLFVLNNRCRIYGKEQNNKRTLDRVKPILKYVEMHYSEHISISDMASLSGFSESHFMRYFKDTMGTSFVDYLRDYRLTMAARMLQRSDSSILEISVEAGFSNLSYFNRCFKSKYNLTPREYRKL